MGPSRCVSDGFRRPVSAGANAGEIIDSNHESKSGVRISCPEMSAADQARRESDRLPAGFALD
jgi:hypothetical protein